MFLGFPGLLLSEGLKTFSRVAGFSLMTIGWAIVAEWILGFNGVAELASPDPRRGSDSRGLGGLGVGERSCGTDGMMGEIKCARPEASQ